ncbi:MAG: FKBP-type peptidyl-prolyl cis-trans isomerase [Planctomycetaceae bacterium]|nr:FKBP-type peptidyl-prolyl cis-trans isomerase [Planctomycetaceae bacterium]
MTLKTVSHLLAAILLAAAPFANAQEKAPKLDTSIDKVSFHIGMQIGNDLKRQGLEVAKPELIAAGIAASLAGEKSPVAQEEIRAAFEEIQKIVEAKQAEKAKVVLEAGEKFLAENKAKPGVKTTKSGLQYLVVKEGTGATPKASSTVTTHYRGTFIDGNKFDSSYEGDAPTAADQPATFPVSGVIKGWTEALQLMKVGAKYRLFIPSDLAYGPAGRPSIPPHSVLIFDLELLNVEE